MGETRLLAHVETLVRPIQWRTFGSRSISSFFFSVEFWQQLGRVAALTLNSSSTECRIMTPEVLWLLFSLFLLKIICLLLHATGQISNFKTKKQQGQDFPPSQPFFTFTYTGNPSRNIRKRLNRYQIYKSIHSLSWQNNQEFPPKKGFNLQI